MKVLQRIKQWHLAATGAALILLSTVVSGNWIYKTQNEIDQFRREITLHERAIEASSRERDLGSLVATLATVENQTAMGRPNLDKKIIQSWTEVLAANLAEVNVRMAVAAGKEKDINISKEIALAKNKASQGDGGFASYDVMLKLINESGNYQDRMKQEITSKNNRLARLELNKNRMYFGALILQVCGLVLLLLKDTPVTTQKECGSAS